jgi:hypothetical protein
MRRLCRWQLKSSYVHHDVISDHRMLRVWRSGDIQDDYVHTRYFENLLNSSNFEKDDTYTRSRTHTHTHGMAMS